MGQTNYRVTNFDGTRERAGFSRMDDARRVAQEIANEDGEAVEISDDAGRTVETVRPEVAE